MLEVVEADPVVKGQTAASSYKPAKLSNGVKTSVPPFIETGEKIVVRTEDAQLRGAGEGLTLGPPPLPASDRHGERGPEGRRSGCCATSPRSSSSRSASKARPTSSPRPTCAPSRPCSEELTKARPGYAFLMEESGASGSDNWAWRWVVDPLDGTTNFLHGIPHWASASALEQRLPDGRSRSAAGLIYAPVVDEMFWAEKGAGAFVNERRLRVSARREMQGRGVRHRHPVRRGRRSAASSPSPAPSPS